MFWNRRPTRVYADAAAATPLSRRSRRELVRLLSVYGNAGALHKEAVEAKNELEAARATIARSIGAHADEIIFTASGTEANNLALHGVLSALKNSPLRRDVPRSSAGSFSSLHAITIAVEHQSVLEPLRALAREGAQVSEVGVDHEGVIDLEEFKKELRPDTALVSVQLVNSEVGTIEPLKEISKIIKRTQQGETLLHTDASQAPLWVRVNVDSLGVDLMTLDAQKVLGPKGIGCLYVRRGTPIEPILWGGKQEAGLRGGTENIPQAGAFAVALADAQSGVERRAAATAAVRDVLWQEIRRLIPNAILNGPSLSLGTTRETRAANNLNVSVPGLEAEMAVIAMDALGVAVSTRSACNIGSAEPSHVIKALGVPKELSGTAIRITLLPSATRAQARRIAEALKDAADRYRKK
jgi:cysteine desulfurase